MSAPKFVKDTNIPFTADIKLFGYFKGKAVGYIFKTRKDYDKWCENLRVSTTNYLANLQDDEAKKKAIDLVSKQLEALTAIHEVLNPMQRHAWMLSVNILLKLKSIRNDDMNGWQVVDLRGLKSVLG